MRERQSSMEFRNKKYKTRRVKQRVPQCGVTSPKPLRFRNSSRGHRDRKICGWLYVRSRCWQHTCKVEHQTPELGPTSCTWSADKDTLLTSYKAIARFVVSYAAPVCSANKRAMKWKNIQDAQRQGAFSWHQWTIYLRRRRFFPYISITIYIRYLRSHPNHHNVIKPPQPDL